ncbi:hypothetical protein [Mesonia sp. HuA40]|uniref:hypothetical protein n=1 Tax=Mesonia sp. HuA40 TaxID=2602761 RepID=UPI0011C80419|nr:hypothetical protein [Mesonia sp. HuA40]TXK72526.1 hypothetical protein FT993_06740 [Mesonia sp. HuA40]
MSKLTLDALKSRAEATASNELLATISGGTENDCHPPCEDCIRDQALAQGTHQPIFTALKHLIFH